jgi:hypothetical protein
VSAGLRVVILIAIVGGVAALTVWHRRRVAADATSGAARWPALPDELSAANANGSSWVIFTTPLCVSCRQVEAELARSRPDDRVIMIDATAQPDLADRYGVKRAPTTIAADHRGRVVARLVGVEDVRAHLAA